MVTGFRLGLYLRVILVGNSSQSRTVFKFDWFQKLHWIWTGGEKNEMFWVLEFG